MVEAKSGLMGSVRRLSISVLSIVGTRLALLANELQEERLRLTQMLFFASLALFFFGMSVLLLTIFVVVYFWDDYRLAALAIFTIIFFLAGIVMALLARRQSIAGSKLFSTSLAELEKDKQSLRGKHE